MENEKIKEGNRIIAEFMGAKFIADGNIFQYPNINPPTINSSFLWNDFALQYHTSWDWLMPVVQKISSIYEDHQYFFADNYDEYEFNIFACSIFGRIEYVFRCCLKFINWYNQNFK